MAYAIHSAQDRLYHSYDTPYPLFCQYVFHSRIDWAKSIDTPPNFGLFTIYPQCFTLISLPTSAPTSAPINSSISCTNPHYNHTSQIIKKFLSYQIQPRKLFKSSQKTKPKDKSRLVKSILASIEASSKNSPILFNIKNRLPVFKITSESDYFSDFTGCFQFVHYSVNVFYNLATYGIQCEGW